eukprot:1159436-Pelagomonas_calceolata.AAC.2
MSSHPANQQTEPKVKLKISRLQAERELSTNQDICCTPFNKVWCLEMDSPERPHFQEIVSRLQVGKQSIGLPGTSGCLCDDARSKDKKCHMHVFHAPMLRTRYSIASCQAHGEKVVRKKKPEWGRHCPNNT